MRSLPALRSVASWVSISSSFSDLTSRWVKGGRIDWGIGIIRFVGFLSCSSWFTILLFDLTLLPLSKSSTNAHYLSARSVALCIASRLILNSWSFYYSGLRFWIILSLPTHFVNLPSLSSGEWSYFSYLFFLCCSSINGNFSVHSLY